MSKITFDFHLVDIETAIQQSGLTWFWLTDGFYWLDIGDKRLFEETQEVLNFWEVQGLSTLSNYEKCMGYQVVRYWEDMLEILPTIIDPVPKCIHELFLKADERIANDINLWWDYTDIEEQKPKYKKWGLPFHIPFYADQHSLNTMHIRFSPSLEFWRYIENDKDEMWVRWDFTQTELDEKTNRKIPVWTAGKGLIQVEYKDFIQSFIGFDKKLMTQMQDRIDKILSSKRLQDLYPKNYDFSILQKEHEERKLALEKALSYTKSDWETILKHYQQAGILP